MSFSTEHFQNLVKSPLKINQYNHAEVKATLDDNLAKLLPNEFGFQENTTQFWTKVIFGYLSCIVAGGCALYSYLVPFKESKVWSAVFVALYIVLSAYYQLYVYRNRDVVFVGQKDKIHIKIISKMKKPSPIYKLAIYSSPKVITNLKESSCLLMENSVEKFFDETGQFDIIAFSQQVKQGVAQGSSKKTE